MIDGRSDVVFDLQKGEYPLMAIIDESFDAYCKLLLGGCGVGVFHLRIKDGVIEIDGKKSDYKALYDLFCKGTFILQEKIIQHERLSLLYPLSVNTLRIVTCADTRGKIRYLSSVLRLGANGNTVDNWAAGGLVVGISANGSLKKYGFYEFQSPKVSSHPDTGIQFEDYSIPYYKEAVSLCLRLHRMFYGIVTIGWDVAITDFGPVIIEGNDNYEISLMQVADHGLKREWGELYGKRFR